MLSFVERLPPFDFVKHKGFKYIRIRSQSSVDQNILYIPDKKIAVIPLMDPRIQIYVVPKNLLLLSDNLCDGIKSIMKDVDESKVKKLQSILIPSFSVSMINKEMSGFSLKLDELLKAQGGCESAKIELISGSAPAESLIDPVESSPE